MVRLLVVVSLLLPGVAAAVTSRPTKQIYVGVYLHDVTRLNLKDGLFDVDLECWAKWRGTFDTGHLRIANSAEINREPLGSERDGDWRSERWRVRGTLRGNFPVSKFPLDEQTLAVTFELPARFGRIVPDLASSDMAPGFSITDWHYRPEFRPVVERAIYSSDLGSVDNEGRASVVNRVGFQVTLKRPILTTVLKLFLPLCIVGLMAFLALFLHPDLIDARSAIGVTALLSCFAFQFTISDSLPAVAYLTLADLLFLTGYVFSSIVLVGIVVTYNLNRRGRERAALAADRALRVALPLVTAVFVWAVLPSRQPPPTDRPAPLPEMPRRPSARDVVRIGSNTSFRSILALVAHEGAYWPLAYKDREGDEHPLLVERLPGVTNRAMRFLSGGGLEVSWRLRRGARWSDGRPLTVDDLLLPRRAYLNEHIRSFRRLDERTMVISWKATLAQSLEAPSIWPSHVLGRYITKKRDDTVGYEKARKRLRARPIPSVGPYHIVRFEAGKRAVAEANPHFIGPPPSIRRIEERRYPSRKALFEAFRRGEVDITLPNGVTMEDAVALRAERPDAVHIVPSNFFIFLSPDLNHPELKQLEVRRAILRAIDRERLAREVYGEAGAVAHVPVPGAPPPGTEVTRHDPDKARAVLGARGLRLPLFTRGTSVDQQIASRVVEDLARVGVTLSVQKVKSTIDVYKTHRHGGLVLHVIAGMRDKNPMAYWNLPVKGGRYPPDARNAAYTDAVHAMVERDLHAIYPERRRQLRDALFAEFSRRLPQIPLVFAAKRVLADPRLRGWETGPEEYFGARLETWYWASR